MSKFITHRDVSFFNGINLELINDIIETPIIFYCLIPEHQNTNIYGESVDKLYEPGIEVNALIQHDDETTEDDTMITDINQNIIVSFHRNTLKQKKFYPTRGDIIKYYNAYYEVSSIVDNQLLAGRPELSHSIICSAHMSNRLTLNIRYES